MTTERQISISLEKMFLNEFNIKKISEHLGRDVKNEMITWASTQDLDDYESVQMNYIESLDYINIEFSKKHKRKTYESNMATGQNYPKYYISEGVEQYTVNDFRKHDANQLQNIMRSNDNFRYGNKVKPWETSLYKRHYDKDEHANGLGDTRELNTLEKKYNMDKIYGSNYYESSDSKI